jgi:hypothetical protein
MMAIQRLRSRGLDFSTQVSAVHEACGDVLDGWS